MIAQWQRLTFEQAAPLGPHWASVASGFAVVLCGVLYLTEAGERYLASLDGQS